MVALCWGKITREANRLKVPVRDLTRVIMIHELAHLVSHLGFKPEYFNNTNNDYWAAFDCRDEANVSDLREIVAQMATEDYLRLANNQSLTIVSEELLKHQSDCYTAHRKLIEEFGDKIKYFWPSFRRRRNGISNKGIQTRTALDIARDWISAEAEIEGGNDAAGANLDF